VASVGRVVTLTEFLLARIAEDEARASEKGIDDPPGGHLDLVTDCDCDEDHLPNYFLAVKPARVLAECQAKRQLVTRVAGNEDMLGAFLRDLSWPYANHPDYDQSWRP
jgi:hypothetical protein